MKEWEDESYAFGGDAIHESSVLGKIMNSALGPELWGNNGTHKQIEER